MARMRGVWQRPDGLAYHPDLISTDEEAGLLRVLGALEMREVRMHGQVARRTVRHFDYEYGYESWGLTPTDALPDALHEVRDRCARLAGVAPNTLAQTLVTRYPPGAAIGWHRDAPMFGPVVVGVSLGSACALRFQRGSGADRLVFEQPLAARSGYVLAGAARSRWQHSIPPVPHLRYSITFRTIRRRHPPETLESMTSESMS